MKQQSIKWSLLIIALGAVLTLGACKKKESASAPTAAGAAGPNRFHLSQSELDPGRTVGFTDLADQQCDRRVDRRHWRGTAERLAKRVPNGFHDLSSDRQGIGW